MNPLIIVIGAYGSGKSEYSINMANKLNNEGKKVCLVDLDVVNPYFRSRDVRDKFAALGIDVIAPEGQFSHADLPMISPRIKGAIQNKDLTVILDVGGDPAGCRALGRFHDDILNRGYEMRHVVNTKRPFTSSKEEILEMKWMLEYTSKLEVSEFISNTNLMEFTDIEIIESGIDILNQASIDTDIPFNTFLVLDKHDSIAPSVVKGKNKEVLSYFLSKPWEGLIMKGI
jgi:hypothetical protein